MTSAIIQQALQAFTEDKLVSVPTETVYGLAAPMDRPDLVEKVFFIKKRPKTSALSILVSSISMAEMYTSNFSFKAKVLAKKYWPGPLTLVLPALPSINPSITAGTGFIGLRMPDQTLTKSIIEALDMPLATPSANPHGKPSPTNAAQVRAYFSTSDVFIVDGGPCNIGTESTIVKVIDEEIEILRIGALSEEEILSNF